MRQGAILSPSLYCLFVDELLDILTSSGLGVKIGGSYCGAPMYANDIALIAESAEELQSMLDIVENYARKWRYQLNSEKSVVMVFGESARSRSVARCHRAWYLGGSQIHEVDEHHHLGVSDQCTSPPWIAPMSDVRPVVVPSLH